MMRKMILAVGLAVILAVPAGVALAQTDEEAAADETVVTTVAPDQVREQARIQDPAECDGTCPRLEEGYAVQAEDQLRTQQRLHDPALCDGDGEQIRRQLRMHTTQSAAGADAASPGYGQGEKGGYGAGAGDGTGPIHEGAGAGNQYGLGG